MTNWRTILLLGLGTTLAGAAFSVDRQGLSGTGNPQEGIPESLSDPMIDVVDPITPEVIDYVPTRGGSIQTDTFVNSQGRRILYKFELPGDIDLSNEQAILVYFHGNNTSSQQDVVDAFFPGIASRAHALSLIPIVVASPETRNPPQEEIRQWYSSEDALLLHEFLRDGLEEHFTVDHESIYFAGGSQGTCFLHDFMQVYGEHYGGGFYGGCGCYNSPDPTWDPPASFRENMQVLINSSTDDFLLEPSHVGYGYYKYTIGLDTRGDLDREGAHCTTHWSGLDMALDWFLDIEPIPEEPFEPHWTRVSAEDDVIGLALDSNQNLWMTLRETNPDQAIFMHSEDRGLNWTEVGTRPGLAQRFSGYGENLFLIQDDELFRSTNDAASFTSTEPDPVSGGLAVDRSGIVYRSGFGGAYWSEDGGSNWNFFNDDGRLLVNDATNVIDPPRVFLTTPEWNLEIASPVDGSVNTVSDTPSGQPVAMAWDGQSLWAIAPEGDATYRLFRSADEGLNWVEISLSGTPMEDYYWYGKQLTALASGRIVIHGGNQSAWMTDDDGQNWIRIPGLATAYDGTITARGSDIFATDGDAVFRLRLSDVEGLLFRDKFEAIQP